MYSEGNTTLRLLEPPPLLQQNSIHLHIFSFMQNFLDLDQLTLNSGACSPLCTGLQTQGRRCALLFAGATPLGNNIGCGKTKGGGTYGPLEKGVFRKIRCLGCDTMATNNACPNTCCIHAVLRCAVHRRGILLYLVPGWTQQHTIFSARDDFVKTGAELSMAATGTFGTPKRG